MIKILCGFNGHQEARSKNTNIILTFDVVISQTAMITNGIRDTYITFANAEWISYGNMSLIE